nr:hypothetical protein [Derxia gummosa]
MREHEFRRHRQRRMHEIHRVGQPPERLRPGRAQPARDRPGIGRERDDQQRAQRHEGQARKCRRPARGRACKRLQSERQQRQRQLHPREPGIAARIRPARRQPGQPAEEEAGHAAQEAKVAEGVEALAAGHAALADAQCHEGARGRQRDQRRHRRQPAARHALAHQPEQQIDVELGADAPARPVDHARVGQRQEVREREVGEHVAGIGQVEARTRRAGRFQPRARERQARRIRHRQREEGQRGREQVERQQPARAPQHEGPERSRPVEPLGIGAEQDVAAQHEEEIDHQIAGRERAGAQQMQVVEGDQQGRHAAQSFECVDQGRAPSMTTASHPRQWCRTRCCRRFHHHADGRGALPAGVSGACRMDSCNRAPCAGNGS